MLDLFRLLVDFGFFVLIWAVQLVIYPSFNFYSKENLYIWHNSYTVRVSFIVVPIMLSQLILASVQLYKIQDWYTILSMLIIIALWLLTFLIFVPLHQSIDKNQPIKNACAKLVSKNWMRTVLWTLLFLLSLLHYIFIT